MRHVLGLQDIIQLGLGEQVFFEYEKFVESATWTRGEPAQIVANFKSGS